MSWGSLVDGLCTPRMLRARYLLRGWNAFHRFPPAGRPRTALTSRRPTSCIACLFACFTTMICPILLFLASDKCVYLFPSVCIRSTASGDEHVRSGCLLCRHRCRVGHGNVDENECGRLCCSSLCAASFPYSHAVPFSHNSNNSKHTGSQELIPT